LRRENEEIKKELQQVREENVMIRREVQRMQEQVTLLANRFDTTTTTTTFTTLPTPSNHIPMVKRQLDSTTINRLHQLIRINTKKGPPNYLQSISNRLSYLQRQISDGQVEDKNGDLREQVKELQVYKGMCK
jgi:hypothetical protein